MLPMSTRFCSGKADSVMSGSKPAKASHTARFGATDSSAMLTGTFWWMAASRSVRPASSTLGNIQPTWTGGWGNQISYRNFSVNTLLDIRRGGKLYSVTNMFGEYAGVLESSLRGREVDFDDPGVLVQGIDVATGQPNTTRITAEEYFHGLFGYTEDYVYDAGYVKLRELRVSYNLPGTWANRSLERAPRPSR